MFADLPDAVAELFADAQTFGRRRYIPAGMHVLRPRDRTLERRARKLRTAAMRLARAHYVVPLPPLRAQPCPCGGVWEWRPGHPRAVHVGTQGAVRCARPSGSV